MQTFMLCRYLSYFIFNASHTFLKAAHLLAQTFHKLRDFPAAKE